MSDQTKADLEVALSAHLLDETGEIVTDWALVAAMTKLENIGTGTTVYWCEGNPGQPVHVTVVGLLRYGSEHATFGDDDDD